MRMLQKRDGEGKWNISHVGNDAGYRSKGIKYVGRYKSFSGFWDVPSPTVFPLKATFSKLGRKRDIGINLLNGSQIDQRTECLTKVPTQNFDVSPSPIPHRPFVEISYRCREGADREMHNEWTENVLFQKTRGAKYSTIAILCSESFNARKTWHRKIALRY